MEISRSRVRTSGKAGYGLYRVRGSLPILWSIERGGGVDRTPGRGEPTLWTPYAFTLPEIRQAVTESIQGGTPACPTLLKLPNHGGRGGWPADRHFVTVPTRWTSAYTGRRDLGAGDEVASLASFPAGEGSTVRSRQRASNAAFQAEHLERRAHGLRERHAAKLQRNGQKPECGSC